MLLFVNHQLMQPLAGLFSVPTYSYRYLAWIPTLAVSISTLTVLVGLPLTSCAQSAPPLPQLPPQDAITTTVTPGAVIQHNKNLPFVYPVPLPRYPDDPVENRNAAKRTPTEMSALEKVWVEKILVEGNTLLPKEWVQAQLKPYESRYLTFNDLEKLTTDLTQEYRRRGYVTSQMYVPVQNFTQGTITLKALESRIGDITVAEGKYFKPRAVLPRLKSKEGDILSLNPVEFNLLDINQNPDLKVKVVLKAGKDAGETDVNFKIVDQHPYHISPYMDNLGRNSIGNQRFGALVTHNNVLGFGDQAVSGVNLSKRNVGVVSQYDLPIGPYGTRLGFRHAYSHLTLGGQLSSLNIASTANIYTALVTQPFIKRPKFDFSGDVAVDFKELNTTLFDGTPAKTPFNSDEIRVLRPGLNVKMNDKWGQTQFRQEASIGLDMLGANQNNDSRNSKAGSGSQFVHFNNSIQRIQPLPFSTIGVVRLNSQLANDRLLAAEQMQIGGAYTVRGYQEGRAISDRGFFLSTEYYVPSFFIPKKVKIPFTQRPMREGLYWIAFGDFGIVNTKDPIPGERSTTTLASTGIGIRIQFTKYLVGRLDVGVPLVRLPGDAQNPRFHFGLQSSIF